MDLVQLKTFFLRYRLYIVIVFALLFIPVLYFILIIAHSRPRSTDTNVAPIQVRVKPTQTQEAFSVISTSPINNATNVYAGELPITFTTDKPILSAASYTVSISPQLPNYWKLNTVFPNTTVTMQVYGGLATNTTYTVTVSDQAKNVIYTWSFLTAAAPGESSSKLAKDSEAAYNAQYFPLFDYIPYTTTDFSVDYTDKLTLLVKIKNSSIDQVKQEVIDWIKSKGVDPTTHTINYVNSF